MDQDTLQWHLSCAPTGPLRARQANDYPHWNRWLNGYTRNAVEDAELFTAKMNGGATICFAITVDERINGQAFISTAVDGHKYRFVTVTAGAILSIHQLCFYAMSRKDVLPSIGNVALEDGQTVDIAFDRRFQYLSSVLSQSTTKPTYPKCPQRLLFAYKMAFGAISFLIKHEFAHCLNGHIWPSQASLEERFTEAPPLSSGEQTRKSHACELQADQIAARSLFGLVYNDYIRADLQCWRNELAPFSLPASLYPVVTGIFLLFRILGSPSDIPTLQEDFYRGSHPHPIIRSRIIGAHFAGFAQGHVPKDADGWIWAAVIALSSSSEIWQTLTGIREAITYTLDDVTEISTEIRLANEYYVQCLSSEILYLNDLQSRTGLPRMNLYKPNK